MSVIKFNQWTKEIEMTGSESFIESNFNEIQNLLDESFGVKKMIASIKTKAKANQEPISSLTMKEFQAGAEIRHELAEASPESPVTKSSTPEISQESKAIRPPVRKYIRKEGTPGHQRITVEVVEQKPREVSIASLKRNLDYQSPKSVE